MNFHVKAMLVGAATLLLAVGAFLWIVVVDKGTLIVTADPSFSIEAIGDRIKIPETLDCEAASCSIRLPSGEYEVTITKESYYDEYETVTVARGDKTQLTIDFDFIPDVREAGTYDDFNFVFEQEDLSDRFTFEMDTTYDKQKMTYVDPETDEETIWSYFNKPLEDPAVYPHPDLTHALVFDRADEEPTLYLIDGVDFSRASLRSLNDIQTLLWNPYSFDFIAQSGTDYDDDLKLWIYSAESEELARWAFELDLSKLVWDTEGRLVFATQQNLSAVEGDQNETTTEALMALINGDYDVDPTEFSIGQYDPVYQTYDLLFEVPTSYEVDYLDVLLMVDPTSGKIYFTNGEKVYEVMRGE